MVVGLKVFKRCPVGMVLLCLYQRKDKTQKLDAMAVRTNWDVNKNINIVSWGHFPFERCRQSCVQVIPGAIKFD